MGTTSPGSRHGLHQGLERTLRNNDAPPGGSRHPRGPLTAASAPTRHAHREPAQQTQRVSTRRGSRSASSPPRPCREAVLRRAQRAREHRRRRPPDQSSRSPNVAAPRAPFLRPRRHLRHRKYIYFARIWLDFGSRFDLGESCTSTRSTAAATEAGRPTSPHLTPQMKRARLSRYCCVKKRSSRLFDMLAAMDHR